VLHLRLSRIVLVLLGLGIRSNGAYHCNACEASGSWFDLRQHVHGHAVPGIAADGGAEGTAARPADAAWRRAQQELLTSPVLAQLTGHGLKVATLQHYGVGATPGYAALRTVAAVAVPRSSCPIPRRAHHARSHAAPSLMADRRASRPARCLRGRRPARRSPARGSSCAWPTAILKVRAASCPRPLPSIRPHPPAPPRPVQRSRSCGRLRLPAAGAAPGRRRPLWVVHGAAERVRARADHERAGRHGRVAEHGPPRGRAADGHVAAAGGPPADAGAVHAALPLVQRRRAGPGGRRTHGPQAGPRPLPRRALARRQHRRALAQGTGGAHARRGTGCTSH